MSDTAWIGGSGDSTRVPEYWAVCIDHRAPGEMSYVGLARTSVTRAQEDLDHHLQRAHPKPAERPVRQEREDMRAKIAEYDSVAAQDEGLLDVIEQIVRSALMPITHEESDMGLSEAHSESYRLGWRAGFQVSAIRQRERDAQVAKRVGEGRRPATVIIANAIAAAIEKGV